MLVEYSRVTSIVNRSFSSRNFIPKMVKLTLILLVAFGAFCCADAADKTKRKLNCKNGPPSDAEFTACSADEDCTGVKNMKGKKCCALCGGDKANKGRGYYCNDSKYTWCLKQNKTDCTKTPPADAEFQQCEDNEDCTGVKIIKGKKCCAKCAYAAGNEARGYYCNPKYCPKQAATSSPSSSTTASSSDSTSSSGSTTGSSSDSTSSGSDSTTAASGSSGSSDSTSSSSDSTSGSDSTTSGSSDSSSSA